MVVASFRAVHGEKYNYSKTVYVNSSTKVLITCPAHGDFEVLPVHHKNGVGCRNCYFESQKISLTEFLHASRSIWGDIYDYSLIPELPGGREKVQIFCNVHQKLFNQEPRNHMRGYTGCPNCKSSKLTGSREKLGTFKSQEELNEGMIAKAEEIHGGRYDYSEFVYVNYATKGIIICRIHGRFLQTASNHLKGNGCPQCARNSLKSNTFKEKCNLLGISYHRALKRRQAGLSEEKIFREGYIRNERAINEITIGSKTYPNIETAVRLLRPPGSATTISRWLKEGVSPEDAFERIPNPGYADGIIYVVVNQINDKKYVGLTIQTLDRRWVYHIEQANRGFIKDSNSLHAAIRQYGPENFTIEQIDVGTTKRDLEAKEIRWINEFNTLIPNGYNISKGGVSGGSNKKPTVVDGQRFQSVREASEYIASTRRISLHAAKRRLLSNRIDVKTPSKTGESYVKTKVYRTWSYIIHSVLNPRSKYYISGVTICDEWREFESFRDDVGEPLDSNFVFFRLDRTKGFYKDNCAWMTRKEYSQHASSS